MKIYEMEHLVKTQRKMTMKRKKYDKDKK